MSTKYSDPYKPPESELGTYKKPAEFKVKPALAGRRMLNLIIDSVLSLLFMLLIGILINIFILLFNALLSRTIGIVLLYSWFWSILAYSSAFFYYVIFEWLFGKTPAKMITRTTALNIDGSKLNLANSLIRNLCRFIPFDAFSFLMDNRPVGWHDSISKTIVILDKELQASSN